MEKNLLPYLFTLGRLIILRVASLRQERPELLRRVGPRVAQNTKHKTKQNKKNVLNVLHGARKVFYLCFICPARRFLAVTYNDT